MISGLASGLDTESMIESLVQSYQTKISQYNQKITKTEWKQDAYRSIISKMVGFSNKYTSYTSSTNLMSPSFFSGSVKVLAKGDFAGSVSASGKSDSDIELNAVHQLAKAAQYRTKSSLTTGEMGSITAGEDFDLFKEGQINLSNLSGGLSLAFGGKIVGVSFSESGDVDAINDIRSKLAKDQGIDASKVGDADVLASLINQKLANETIVFNNGNSESADKRIKAVAQEDGRIVFEEQGSGKNGVYIYGASGNVAEQLGLSDDDLKNADEKKLNAVNTNTIHGANGGSGLTRSLSAVDYLIEKGETTMNLSLDGTTKQITIPSIKHTRSGDVEKYYLGGKEIQDTYKLDGTIDKTAKQNLVARLTESIQASVKDAFKDKVKVENLDKTDKNLKLKFTVGEGSELVINSGVGDALGIGRTATSYLNTGKTLKDLMKSDGDGGLAGLEPVYEKDENGRIKTDSKGVPIEELNDRGKKQYEFVLNGEKIGTYTEDTKLSEILADINSNKNAGVRAAYSQATQNFTFTSKETGSNSKIEMGKGLAQAMFGSTEETVFTNDQKIGDILPKDTDYSGSNNFKLNVGDTSISFHVDQDDTMDTIMQKANDMLAIIAGDPDEGINYEVLYNSSAKALEVTDKTTGKNVGGSFADGLAKELADAVSLFPDSTFTAGQDAIFTATINGEQKYMTRSSNSVNIDGLTINMEETFNTRVDDQGSPAIKNGRFQVDDGRKSVTFQNQTDSDKIIDAVKDMVNDYNTMMAEVKSAYSTMPYQKSSGSFANYEPLTDDEREGMSESAIERYEEKAKQGILFGDRNLSNLYTKMNQAFSFTNKEDIDTLKNIGISVSFNVSDGTQAITLDEDKLRSMLDSDPDRVSELFTKTDGIMDRMKGTLDTYAKTTGEPKGILIQQSGSPLSSLSLLSNQWQTEIDNYNTQIEKWQDKLTTQVEKYTSQFTRLEQLIQQMNAQSSTLMGMMGG